MHLVRLLCIGAATSYSDTSLLLQSLYPPSSCPSSSLHPASQPFYQCFSYMAYPCCSAQDSYVINSAFSSGLEALYGDCSGCLENLNELVCAGSCSPYLGRFRKGDVVSVTEAACRRLYRSCKDAAQPNGSVRYSQVLKDLYGNARSFCESDLGIPFFHIRVDSAGWDGALLTSCKGSLSPADRNSDYEDWVLRLSIAETVLEQYGHNSPLAESTIRALMLATARSVGIIYDGKTADALEQLTWEIAKFVQEKQLSAVWNLVGLTQHQGAAFLAVSLHQLILKVHSLEEAGVQSFSYDFIRNQVFPHLNTKERDRVEGRPKDSEDWEKRVRGNFSSSSLKTC